MTLTIDAQTKSSHRPHFWVNTGASEQLLVSSASGSTIEPSVTNCPWSQDLDWVQVLRAAEKSSLSFLNDEPDLYDDED